MRSETMTPEPTPPKRGTISEGLLMVPKPQNILNTINKHKRAGSTGTTGDESCTTDEDFDLDTDDPELSLPVTRNLYVNNTSDFGSYSDIATITDKIGHATVMHRNSSDSSVYSEFEKCDDISGYENGSKAGSSDDLKRFEGENGDVDQVDFACVRNRDKTVVRLQNELKEANEELKLRDEELIRLTRIRKDVESELEDLTASLFQVSRFDEGF